MFSKKVTKFHFYTAIKHQSSLFNTKETPLQSLKNQCNSQKKPSQKMKTSQADTLHLSQLLTNAINIPQNSSQATKNL